MPARVRVGYIMTHYPRVAQTFISGEIDTVESTGVEVRTFAMNRPSPLDRLGPDAARRMAQTTYLKAKGWRAVAALGKHLVMRPVVTIKVLVMALRSAGRSPGRMFRRMAHLAQAALVAEIARRERLDYLHAHFGLAPATIAWFAAALGGRNRRSLPFGFTIHGFHDFVDAKESRLDLKARQAAHVFCVSDYTRSQLCCVTDPALWSRFFVVRCGIDLAVFPFRAQTALANPPVVLAVGRLSPEKGFDVLLQAISKLKHDGTPHRLTLVGDGPLRASLEMAAEKAGISDLVEFTGELAPADVRRHLADADVFCLPSFSEGLPISIMEAMATGVPVVTTWIAGIPELAEDEVTALTVPPARADALTGALRRLTSDRALRERLAQAARRKIEQQHDNVSCGAIAARRFAAAASS